MLAKGSPTLSSTMLHELLQANAFPHRYQRLTIYVRRKLGGGGNFSISFYAHRLIYVNTVANILHPPLNIMYNSNTHQYLTEPCESKIHGAGGLDCLMLYCGPNKATSVKNFAFMCSLHVFMIKGENAVGLRSYLLYASFFSRFLPTHRGGCLQQWIILLII